MTEEPHDMVRASITSGMLSTPEESPLADVSFSSPRDQTLWRRLLAQAVAPSLLTLLRRRLVVSGFLLLALFVNIIAAWPVVPPQTAFALDFHNPNPPLPTPSWLKQSSSSSGSKPDLNQSAPVSTSVKATGGLPQRSVAVPMKPARLILTTAAQHFVSSDGQISVDIPAGSLKQSQLGRLSGGVWLYITQVQPASGGLDSSDLFFGTYEFQFFNAQGQVLSSDGRELAK